MDQSSNYVQTFDMSNINKFGINLAPCMALNLKENLVINFTSQTQRLITAKETDIRFNINQRINCLRIHYISNTNCYYPVL